MGLGNVDERLTYVSLRGAVDKELISETILMYAFSSDTAARGLTIISSGCRIGIVWKLRKTSQNRSNIQSVYDKFARSF